MIVTSKVLVATTGFVVMSVVASCGGKLNGASASPRPPRPPRSPPREAGPPPDASSPVLACEPMDASPECPVVGPQCFGNDWLVGYTWGACTAVRGEDCRDKRPAEMAAVAELIEHRAVEPAST